MSVVAGCGGSHQKTQKEQFCAVQNDLKRATTNLSATQLQEVYRANLPKFDDYLSKAPAEVKTDAQTVVDAVKKLAATGDVNPLLNTADARAAGQRLDLFCATPRTTTSSH